MPACVAASSRLICSMRIGIDPQRRFHRAAAVARARREGALSLRPETASTKRLARRWPTSSRPISLLPSAAVCASSPSTISSGSGGTEPICQTSRRSPIGFHQFRVQEERQAFVAHDVVMGADVFVAGIADQDRSRHQLVNCRGNGTRSSPCAHRRPSDRRCCSANGLSPGPAVQRNSETEMDLRSMSRCRDHRANLVMGPRRRNGQLRGTIKDVRRKGE